MLLEEAFEGAPVLVAGGYGFIGSNLVRRLVRLGARVTVVDALVPNTGANRFNLSDLEGLITVHVVNMVDEEAMRELMRGRTLVLNLAGQVSHVYSMCDPHADLTMNCHAQLGLSKPAASMRQARRSSSRQRASSTGGQNTCRSMRATTAPDRH